MACLYCRRPPSGVSFTEAHIFPRNLGGMVSVLDLICESCNRRIGRTLEWPARRHFAPLLSWLGIRGRSHQPPRVEATLTVGDHQARVYIDGRGRPVRVHPIQFIDSEGRRQMLLFGPRDQVGFVSFFGLYYYWVILSRRHQALAPVEAMLWAHPQGGWSWEPQIYKHEQGPRADIGIYSFSFSTPSGGKMSGHQCPYRGSFI